MIEPIQLNAEERLKILAELDAVNATLFFWSSQSLKIEDLGKSELEGFAAAFRQSMEAAATVHEELKTRLENAWQGGREGGSV